MLLGSAVWLGLLSLTPANAAQQEAAANGAEVEEVLVTGSRIRGVVAAGSDIMTVGAETLQETPATTVSKALMNLPQVLNFGNNEQSLRSPTGTNSQRATTINIHGLGSPATLTLFNGMRVSPMGGFGTVVDAAIVPSNALERVEVVADGASALYGADAIAGVVNIITRKSFTGVEVSARGGFADGYRETQLGVIAGKSWGTGRIMAAYEFSMSDRVQGTEIDFSLSDTRPRGGRDYRDTTCAPGNIVVGGVSYAIPAQGVTPATTNLLVPGTVNRCDTYNNQGFLWPQDRHNVTVSVSQDLGERVRVYADGYYYTKKLTDFHEQAQGASSTLLATLAIPTTNAYFLRPAGTTGAVSVQYSFLRDLGRFLNGRITDDTYNVTWGAEVDLFNDWQASISGTLGRNENLSSSEAPNPTALAAALASNNPATALNPFRPGTTTPSVIQAIFSNIFQPEAINKIQVIDFQADGTLAELPGGAMRLAVGGQYQHVVFLGKTLRGTLATGLSGPLTDVNRDIRSAFAEVYVPLVGEGNAMPLVQSLTLSLAGRIDKYSDVGSTTNPKVGVTWDVTDGLRIRGSWGTSFRAPAMADASPNRPGAGVTWISFSDPLSPTNTSTGMQINRGNPNLAPEEGTTKSFGVEWRPSGVPDLHLSATWWDVKYSNQIRTGITPSILSDPAFAYRVTRNPSQALIDSYLAAAPAVTGVRPPTINWIVTGEAINIGLTNASGIDFMADYGFDAGDLGRLSVGVSGTYMLEYETQDSATSPVVNQLGATNFPVKWRVRGRAGWEMGPFEAAAYLNYIDNYRNTTVVPNQRVDDYATIDLNLSYRMEYGSSWAKGTTLSLAVTNVFDTDPPFVDMLGGYDPVYGNVIGRMMSVSLRTRF